MIDLADILPSRRPAASSEPLREPPRPSTDGGAMRRVGLEIKFAGLSPGKAAEIVAGAVNGDCERIGHDELRVDGGLLAAVRLRFDPRLDGAGDDDQPGVLASLGHAVAKTIVPVIELVTDPVPYRQMQQFNLAIDALRRAGARETAAFGLASFGTHLNVEIATTDVVWLTRMVKAYALSEMWLRQRLSPDLARRVTPYIVPWPLEYIDAVVADGYWPGLDRLIDDYLDYNPTSYRDLDLLPLFLSLDPPRVRAAGADAGVLQRRAFHFRLPTTRIAEDGWSPVAAWNMWVRVEELAEDEAKLTRLGGRWREHRRQWFVERDWPETVAEAIA